MAGVVHIHPSSPKEAAKEDQTKQKKHQKKKKKKKEKTQAHDFNKFPVLARELKVIGKCAVWKENE
jgi:hypothetical protein